MTDRDLALKYAPHLYFDINEPIPINKIGFHIIHNSMKSPSSDRDIWIDPDQTAYVIEYQLFYDFDIQHMYDLEHFWVYVDHNGSVVDGEASEHGNFKNCYRYTMTLEDETHIPLFVQPGKHAMLPEGNMFKLFSNYRTVCNKLAGIDGLLVAGMFRDSIYKNSHIDYQVCNYIREHFTFEPSLEFQLIRYSEEIIVPWEELYRYIPLRINKLLQNLDIKA
ncbi:MAG: hypothetical protein K0S76_1431 [Herbinix sp.]|jgi:hypothetical protein|nr:hypothetical protein [Herbinix sp.]